MKVIAISRRRDGASVERIHALQADEARRVWELYAEGVLREVYFRQDRPGGVLVLECASLDEAQAVLGTLPLVAAGLVTFDVIPLGPYTRWSLLFDREG